MDLPFNEIWIDIGDNSFGIKFDTVEIYFTENLFFLLVSIFFKKTSLVKEISLYVSSFSDYDNTNVTQLIEISRCEIKTKMQYIDTDDGFHCLQYLYKDILEVSYDEIVRILTKHDIHYMGDHFDGNQDNNNQLFQNTMSSYIQEENIKLCKLAPPSNIDEIPSYEKSDLDFYQSKKSSVDILTHILTI